MRVDSIKNYSNTSFGCASLRGERQSAVISQANTEIAQNAKISKNIMNFAKKAALPAAIALIALGAIGCSKNDDTDKRPASVEALNDKVNYLEDKVDRNAMLNILSILFTAALAFGAGKVFGESHDKMNEKLDNIEQKLTKKDEDNV